MIESKSECFKYTDELTDLRRRLLKAKIPRSIIQKSKYIIRESVTAWAVCWNTKQALCPELLKDKARPWGDPGARGEFQKQHFWNAKQS